MAPVFIQIFGLVTLAPCNIKWNMNRIFMGISCLAGVVLFFACKDNGHRSLEGFNIRKLDLEIISITDGDVKKNVILEIVNPSDYDLSLSVSSFEYKTSKEWIMWIGGKRYLAVQIKPHPINIKSKSRARIEVMYELVDSEPIDEYKNIVICDFYAYSVDGRDFIDSEFSLEKAIDTLGD